MTYQAVLKLCKKIRSGCERTPYIKTRAKQADLFLTLEGLRDTEIEIDGSYSMLVDILGSVIYGEI